MLHKADKMETPHSTLKELRPLGNLPPVKKTPRTRRFRATRKALPPQSPSSSGLVTPKSNLISAAPRPSGMKKGYQKARNHTTDQLEPEGDEYIPREYDAAGEKKITRTGNLLNGREYSCRTFLLPNRGDKLFMLASKCAKALGYRDSCLLFKTKSIYRIIATQVEKDDLMQKTILPRAHKGRQVAIVTAKSIFRHFGSRIILNGRRVRDDYWEAKARIQGFTEEDIAGEKRPGATKASDAAGVELRALGQYGDIGYSNSPEEFGVHAQPQNVPPGMMTGYIQYWHGLHSSVAFQSQCSGKSSQYASGRLSRLTYPDAQNMSELPTLSMLDPALLGTELAPMSASQDSYLSPSQSAWTSPSSMLGIEIAPSFTSQRPALSSLPAVQVPPPDHQTNKLSAEAPSSTSQPASAVIGNILTPLTGVESGDLSVLKSNMIKATRKWVILCCHCEGINSITLDFLDKTCRRCSNHDLCNSCNFGWVILQNGQIEQVSRCQDYEYYELKQFSIQWTNRMLKKWDIKLPSTSSSIFQPPTGPSIERTETSSHEEATSTSPEPGGGASGTKSSQDHKNSNVSISQNEPDCRVIADKEDFRGHTLEPSDSICVDFEMEESNDFDWDTIMRAGAYDF